MTAMADIDTAGGSERKLAPGMLVRFPYGEYWKRLGVVDALLAWGEVRVVSSSAGGDAGQLEYSTHPESIVAPVEQIDPDEHQETQALLAGHAASLREKISELDDDLSQANQHQAQAEVRASEAQKKITSMREYAIEAYRDGDICLDGLNRFLCHHDLPEYPPRRTAQVRLEFDVSLPNCDESDAYYRVRDYVTVKTEDEDVVEITSDPRDVTVDDTEADDI